MLNPIPALWSLHCTAVSTRPHRGSSGRWRFPRWLLRHCTLPRSGPFLAMHKQPSSFPPWPISSNPPMMLAGTAREASSWLLQESCSTPRTGAEPEQSLWVCRQNSSLSLQGRQNNSFSLWGRREPGSGTGQVMEGGRGEPGYATGLVSAERLTPAARKGKGWVWKGKQQRLGVAVPIAVWGVERAWSRGVCLLRKKVLAPCHTTARGRHGSQIKPFIHTPPRVFHP